MIECGFRRSLVAILSCAALLASGCEARPETPRTFYVDFAAGSDEATGLSASQPWKHAPGDPQAVGRPAQQRLHPGDVVLFRGNVVYRGAIKLNASGAPGQPITYRGAGFGEGKAVISGRDEYAVKLADCAGTPACAGVEDAAGLKLVQLPITIKMSDQVALGGQMLHLSQAPALDDPFWFDDLDRFQTLTRAEFQPAPAANTWSLRNPFVSKMLGSAPIQDLGVEIWGMPNSVTSTRASTYDPATGTILTVGEGIQPYPDKDTRFALINHPRLIRQPLDYATVAGGTAIVVKAPSAPESAKFEVSRRKIAFDIAEQSHIVVEDLEITGFSAYTGDWNQGSAMVSNSKDVKDLTFRRNYVHDITSWAGIGAVHIHGAQGVTVTDNRFERMWRGGGVVIGGQAQDVRILRNTFDKISRTGVALFGAKRVWIDHNRLSGLMGHHGNSIAVYLDNQDILISNNSIQQSVRGITFHGGGTEPHRINIRNNLFWTIGDSGSGVQSWGDNTRQVTIERNVLAAEGGRFAMKLHASDTGLKVRRNVINGFAVGGSPSSDWIVEGNTFTAENYIASPEAERAYMSANTFAPKLQKAVFGLLSGKGADPKICAALQRDPQNVDAEFPWLTASERTSLSSGVGPDDICGK